MLPFNLQLSQTVYNTVKIFLLYNYRHLNLFLKVMFRFVCIIERGQNDHTHCHSQPHITIPPLTFFQFLPFEMFMFVCLLVTEVKFYLISSFFLSFSLIQCVFFLSYICKFAIYMCILHYLPRLLLVCQFQFSNLVCNDTLTTLHQVIIAQWLAQWLTTGRPQVQIPTREKIINSE